MRRFHQIVFIASLLTLSWLAMMGVHELGHVAGAMLTGGGIQRVVLHPLTISRTDVSPNPYPTFVVWLGPILGCLIPLAIWVALPRNLTTARNVAKFFAGFCLIANGVYISLGSFAGVGDCGVMLDTGSPVWALVAFGALAVSVGLYLWHSLGSPSRFFAEPSTIPPRLAYFVLSALLIVVLVESLFSPT